MPSRRHADRVRAPPAGAVDPDIGWSRRLAPRDASGVILRGCERRSRPRKRGPDTGLQRARPERCYYCAAGFRRPQVVPGRNHRLIRIIGIARRAGELPRGSSTPTSPPLPMDDWRRTFGRNAGSWNPPTSAWRRRLRPVARRRTSTYKRDRSVKRFRRDRHDLAHRQPCRVTSTAAPRDDREHARRRRCCAVRCGRRPRSRTHHRRLGQAGGAGERERLGPSRRGLGPAPVDARGPPRRVATGSSACASGWNGGSTRSIPCAICLVALVDVDLRQDHARVAELTGLVGEMTGPR